MTISRIYKQHLRKIDAAKKELSDVKSELTTKTTKLEKVDEQIKLRTDSLTDMNNRLVKDSKNYDSEKKKIDTKLEQGQERLDVIESQEAVQLKLLNETEDKITILNNVHKTLEKDFDNLKENKINFVEESNFLLEEINTLKSQKDNVIKETTKELLSVTKKLEKAENKLEKAETKHNEIMENIGKENEIFSKREKDIVILESRLKKKYPEETLVFNK